MKDSLKTTQTLSLSGLILALTLEVSFTQSVLVNLYLILLIAAYLIYVKKARALCWLVLIPLLPATGTYWSVMTHGTGQTAALLLVSRTYVLAALGMLFVFGVDLEELLLVLEQKKIPSHFIYGILVVVHALPEIKTEIASLMEASLLRGKKYHFWSPMIYLKVLLTAVSWRDHYTEALASRGFTEGACRSHECRYVISKSSLLWTGLIFLSANALLLL